MQVAGELRQVDAQFSRLHGVPAGRALDLYGRAVGGPVAPAPEDAAAARQPDTWIHAGSTHIRSATVPEILGRLGRTKRSCSLAQAQRWMPRTWLWASMHVLEAGAHGNGARSNMRFVTEWPIITVRFS